jgi:HEAT repeat protein
MKILDKSTGISILLSWTGVGVLVAGGVLSEYSYSVSVSYASSAVQEAQADGQLQNLLTSLRDGNPSDRQRAAISLGNLGDKRAVQPLIEALKDGDSFVRDFAVRALGKIGDSRAVEALIRAMGDDNLLVRRSAAASLGVLKDPEAVEPLIKALKDGDSLMRRAAAIALGALGDPRAVAPLMETLGEEDIYVRAGAATALEKIGAPAIPELLKSLDNWAVSPRAAEILKNLNWQPASDAERIRFNIAAGNKQSLLDNWAVAKKILLEDTAGSDTNRVHNAVYALIGAGQNETVPELIGILKEKGTLEMADAFLRSGNESLHKAALDWLVATNNKIPDEGARIVEWGKLKRNP